MVYGRGLDDARPSLTSSCDVVSAGSGPEAQSPWPTAPAEAEARGGRCRHDRRHVFGSCQRRAHATCGPDDPIGRVEPPYVTDSGGRPSEATVPPQAMLMAMSDVLSKRLGERQVWDPDLSKAISGSPSRPPSARGSPCEPPLPRPQRCPRPRQFRPAS